MNEQGTSADVEGKHIEGKSGNRLPSRDLAQERRDEFRKVKLKLVRDVRKNRKGFLKYNSNKRKTKENVGTGDLVTKRKGTERFWHCFYLKSLPSGFHIPETQVATWENFISLLIYLLNKRVVKYWNKDPVRPCNLHPWRYAKLNLTWSWATSHSWPCFRQVVRLADLPTCITIRFCD